MPPGSKPTTLLDLTPPEARLRLEAWVEAAGLPAYRADQLARRLWATPVRTWQEATELPTPLRERLDHELPLPRLVPRIREQALDGTEKVLWELADREAIESVAIPTRNRRTLCISSQAGCALGCVFCATGRMGYRRNLSPFEIVGQVRETIIEDPSRKPTNVVFMGMGEPLLNWPAVDTALTTLNHPDGLGIGARHITVSTVGIVPAMESLARRPEQFRLAISLHSADPEARMGLMPIDRKYPLADVVGAAAQFGRRVTLEYVLIADRNDRESDVRLLLSVARTLKAHVNLLPLHPGGATELKPSPPSRLRWFASRLLAGGVEAVVRRSRGLDINAACGQLYVAAGPRRPVPEDSK